MNALVISTPQEASSHAIEYQERLVVAFKQRLKEEPAGTALECNNPLF